MDVQLRTQRLRYPTVEQLGTILKSDASPIRPLPFMVPEESEKKDEALLRKISALEAQIKELEQQVQSTAERSMLEGREAGRLEAERECAQALADSRAGVAAALKSFSSERMEYFRKAEAETVKLALAIARKILHRESQIDPMLLAGIVRSALDRLGESGKTILRIPPKEHSGWLRVFEQEPGRQRPSLIPSLIPTLIEDTLLKPGACVLETEMGTVELSLDAQLEEIERGFFDVLASDGRSGSRREA
jgi:flagellar assembly protein FliH